MIKDEAVQYEGCDVVIDLRSADSERSTKKKNVEYIRVPMIEDGRGKELDEALQKAIDQVAAAYQAGKKVAFHCSMGRNRTGVVAIGTLLSLGICATMEDAEKLVQRIRPEVHIKGALKDSLRKLFPPQEKY